MSSKAAGQPVIDTQPARQQVGRNDPGVQTIGGDPGCHEPPRERKCMQYVCELGARVGTPAVITRFGVRDSREIELSLIVHSRSDGDDPTIVAHAVQQ